MGGSTTSHSTSASAYTTSVTTAPTTATCSPPAATTANGTNTHRNTRVSQMASFDAPDDFDFGVELMRRKFSHGRPRHRRVSGNARPSYQRTAHPSPALPQVRFLRIPFSRRSSIRTTHDSHPQAARRTTARIRLEPKRSRVRTAPSIFSRSRIAPGNRSKRNP